MIGIADLAVLLSLGCAMTQHAVICPPAARAEVLQRYAGECLPRRDGAVVCKERWNG